MVLFLSNMLAPAGAHEIAIAAWNPCWGKLTKFGLIFAQALLPTPKHFPNV